MVLLLAFFVHIDFVPVDVDVDVDVDTVVDELILIFWIKER